MLRGNFELVVPDLVLDVALGGSTRTGLELPAGALHVVAPLAPHGGLTPYFGRVAIAVVSVDEPCHAVYGHGRNLSQDLPDRQALTFVTVVEQLGLHRSQVLLHQVV